MWCDFTVLLYTRVGVINGYKTLLIVYLCVCVWGGDSALFLLLAAGIFICLFIFIILIYRGSCTGGQTPHPSSAPLPPRLFPPALAGEVFGQRVVNV